MSENQSNFNENNLDLEKATPVVSLYNVPLNGLVEAIKYQIKEGNIDTIEALLALKKVEKIAESVKKDKEIKEIFIDAVRKSLDGGKSLTIHNAQIILTSVHTYYDYSTCNDSVYNKLVQIEEEVAAMKKQREEELKVLFANSDKKLSIPSRTIIQSGIPSLEISDDEFEETIFPPVKHQREGVKVTFKKN